MAWLCLLLLIFGRSPLLAQTPGQTEVMPLQAALLLSDSLVPPLNDALWEPIRLPDNWAQRSFKPAAKAAWYRLEFEPPLSLAQTGSWAVYVPYLHGGGRAFLNWRPLGDITESSPGLQVQWQRPHLLNIPDGALQPGRNVLMLRVPVDAAAGGVEVPQILLGPADDMLAVYEQRLFYVRTVAQFTLGLCLVVGVLVLFIWWRRRAEVLYGVFGLCCVFWAMHTLAFVVEALPPWQWAWLQRLDVAALTGFAISLGGFTVLARSRRSASAVALVLCIAAAGLAMAHDYLLATGSPWLAGLMPAWVQEHVFVLPYTVSLVLVIMGAVLANRFIGTLHELEALNLSLDRRVAEREAVIAQNYQRLVDLEGQRVAAEERQRIMQDMHDGLGAQLFSSLSRTERAAMSQQEMSDALRGCIAEMRLAIDALSTSEDDFETTFSDFRYRWASQFQALGLRCDWQVDIDAAAPELAPHVSLQVLRILQEALTNAVKHAGASELQLRLVYSTQGLLAEVQDNGVGLPQTMQVSIGAEPTTQVAAARLHKGRGLQNMQTRAGRLGATLSLQSRPGQTRVTLNLKPPAKG